MKKYEAILNRFVGFDMFKDWTQFPFNVGKKSGATNAKAVVITPYIKDYPDQTNTIAPLLPEKNILKVFSVSELKEKLALIPMVDCYDEITTECEACEGAGTVDYIFEYKGREYETTDDCPFCEGEGETNKESEIPNGKKEYDLLYGIMLHQSAFNAERLDELLFVAETLECSEIKLVSQLTPTAASFFELKDVDVLLMPLNIHILEPQFIVGSIDFK